MRISNVSISRTESYVQLRSVEHVSASVIDLIPVDAAVAPGYPSELTSGSDATTSLFQVSEDLPPSSRLIHPGVELEKHSYLCLVQSRRYSQPSIHPTEVYQQPQLGFPACPKPGTPIIREHVSPQALVSSLGSISPIESSKVLQSPIYKSCRMGQPT